MAVCRTIGEVQHQQTCASVINPRAVQAPSLKVQHGAGWGRAGFAIPTSQGLK